MANYWEDQEKYLLLGIDDDLYECLHYNPQTFDIDNIKQVLAVHEGKNDGDDWRWVVALKNGKFAFLQGGCDYTGWDCQSWATSDIYDNPEEAAKGALGDVPITIDNGPGNAGLGHLINLFNGNYDHNFEDVYKSLLDQINNKKKSTWKEQTRKDFQDLPRIY